MSEREKALEVLLEGSHICVLNMNDTFGFACAECVDFDTADFDLMVPLLAKHGRHALTAYAAVKTNREPIHCRCGHDKDDYKAARAAIEELQKSNEYFCRAE